MREHVIRKFEAVFGAKPQYVVRAPGRANLIGEHTDYHDGFVMPLAVDRAIFVAVSPRLDEQIRVHSLDFGGETATFSTVQVQDESLPHWVRYVQGAWWLMQAQGFQPLGADLLIGSNVPFGGGMSSSAAMGVAMMEIVLKLLDQNKTQAEKALLAVEIEHQFMGVPCGVLDQMASAAALDQSAMLLDCRTLETQPVPIPQGVSIVVMNTQKARLLSEGGYAKRREESESVNPILGTTALRDATLDLLEAKRAALSEVQYRRARHVITENARCLEMKPILEAGDLTRAGELLNASHASLRDDYAVSVRELDVMSEFAQHHPACYGARMMGGGFGGCAVGMVKTDLIDEFLAYLAPAYEAEIGLKPEFYVCQPAQGSSLERIEE